MFQTIIFGMCLKISDIYLFLATWLILLMKLQVSFLSQAHPNCLLKLYSTGLGERWWNTLQETSPYPTKRESRKIINSKLPAGRGYWVSAQEGNF